MLYSISIEGECPIEIKLNRYSKVNMKLDFSMDHNAGMERRRDSNVEAFWSS